MSAGAGRGRQPRRTGVLGAALGAGGAALVSGVLAVGAMLTVDDVRAVTSPEPSMPAPGDVSDFTDPERWATLPPFRTTGPMLTLTDADVVGAFPEDGAWEPGAIAAVGGQWATSWCDPADVDPPLLSADGVATPDDEHSLVWYVPSGASSSAGLRFDALRWHRAGGAELAAAQQWGRGTADDARTCPGAQPLDASGLPGEVATLTALPEGRDWRVQATTTGGPTAVRLRATVTAGSAEDAGARVSALVTTAVARLAVADDAEQAALQHVVDHPADRPDLGPGHLTSDVVGTPGLTPAAPATPEQARAGWCPEGPPVDVALPEQAWVTDWVDPGAEGSTFDGYRVQERVVRFSGLGDEGGVAAASAYSAALRAQAEACVAQAADGRPWYVTGVDGVDADDTLMTAVQREDGTWLATVTARDGITLVLVRVSFDATWPDWDDRPVVSSLTFSLQNVEAADQGFRG